MCENHEPKPVDEKPEAEIRGGNRREDYMPGGPRKISGMFGHHEDDDSFEEDADGEEGN
jgi:hypothetical protein